MCLKKLTRLLSWLGWAREPKAFLWDSLHTLTSGSMKLEGHVSPEGLLLGLLELQLQEMVGHLLDLGDGRKEVVHRLGEVQDLRPKGMT